MGPFLFHKCNLKNCKFCLCPKSVGKSTSLSENQFQVIWQVMDWKCWDKGFQVQENTLEVGLILEKSTLNERNNISLPREYTVDANIAEICYWSILRYSCKSDITSISKPKLFTENVELFCKLICGPFKQYIWNCSVCVRECGVICELYQLFSKNMGYIYGHHQSV